MNADRLESLLDLALATIKTDNDQKAAATLMILAEALKEAETPSPTPQRRSTTGDDAPSPSWLVGLRDCAEMLWRYGYQPRGPGRRITRGNNFPTGNPPEKNTMSDVATIRLVENADRSCVANFISWQRLVEQLHAAGELKPNEKAVRLEIDERGITYFIEMR